MKMKRFLIIGLVLIVTILNIALPSFCEINPDDYKPNIKSEDSKAVSDFAGPIANTIQVIGTVISVGVVVYLGIKYMISSVEQRAEYKKTLFPVFIGAVLVFAISNLVKIIANIGLEFGS